MFKNYLKVGFRNLLKYKAFSAINILGLATGLTCCILILLYVQYELSYDRFHADADRIYRAAWMTQNPQTRTPHPLAQAMVRDFPEVTSAVSLSPTWGPGLTRPKISVRYEDKQFEEPGFYEADSTFFDVFSFSLLRGDAQTALRDRDHVVITETIARKYFANADPIGKTLIADLGGDFPLTVSGVVEDIPANSHFHFDFLVSYATFKAVETGNYYEWVDFGHYNYIKLAQGVDAKALEARLNRWAAGYLGWSEQQLQDLANRGVHFDLQPILEIHLRSQLKWELEPNGDINYIYIFSAAAVFILLIACINFMNLSTARSSTRAKEVGVRKAVGANRLFLVRQFLGESMLMTIFAVLLALALVEILIPSFNSFAHLNLKSNLLGNHTLVLSVVAITLLVGIIAGIYPAVFLSGFQPVKVLSGKVKQGTKGSRFRKVLVVLQFSISIALIAGTLIVSSQLDFLRNKNLGFEKDQILVVPLKERSLRTRYDAIKAELLSNQNVLMASAVSNVPGERFNQNDIRWEPGDRNVSISEFRVDHDFFKTLDVEVQQGREFSREFETDAEEAFILNETAASQFNWDSPLGKEVAWLDDNATFQGRVIGVVADFHFQSLHQAIAPMAFQVLPTEFNYLLIKVASDNIASTLEFLEMKWAEFDPAHTFEFAFLNDNFDRLYRAEEKMQTLFSSFTVLAVLIACLGLLGLASYSAEQRTKEIGIRKALGASVIGIIGMLSQEFVKLVVLANVIAWPLAYFAMDNWLQNFPYRIDLGPATFVAAGVLACLIALLTVTYQATKAAVANPVESLRYE
jgi:putative ABC transport system permease protein